MTAPADIASAVDRFLSTEKRAVGVEQPIAWVPGFNDHEMVIYVPLEIDGEQTGSKLMIVGFPLAESLKFRIGVLFPGAVCRLDFTDETHSNSLAIGVDGIPGIVRGPHYHSWALNRRFCRGTNLPTKLHNADIFNLGPRTFDSILRWFCSDVGIAGLPTTHRIELPARDRLL
jgi:hypothetical protein